MSVDQTLLAEATQKLAELKKDVDKAQAMIDEQNALPVNGMYYSFTVQLACQQATLDRQRAAVESIERLIKTLHS